MLSTYYDLQAHLSNLIIEFTAKTDPNSNVLQERVGQIEKLLEHPHMEVLKSCFTEIESELKRTAYTPKQTDEIVDLLRQMQLQVEQDKAHWLATHPSIELTEQENLIKIIALKKECQLYKVHLYDVTRTLMDKLMVANGSNLANLIENPQLGLCKSDFDRIFSVIKDKEIIKHDRAETELSNEPLLKKLESTLIKYDQVSNMITLLDEKKEPSLVLDDFKTKLNVTRSCLAEHLDSKTTRFLSALAHILTLGLIYKAENGVFGFKASKGQNAVENINRIIKTSTNHR